MSEDPISKYKLALAAANAEAFAHRAAGLAEMRKMAECEQNAAKAAETIANLETYQERVLGATKFPDSMDSGADIDVLHNACKKASNAGSGDHMTVARRVFAQRKEEFMTRHPIVAGREITTVVFTNKVRSGRIVVKRSDDNCPSCTVDGQRREFGANRHLELGSNLYIVGDDVRYMTAGNLQPYLFWVSYGPQKRAHEGDTPPRKVAIA